MPPTWRRGDVAVAVALLAVLILAALLRFADLAARGFIYWDEAKFALEGIRIEAATQALVGHGHYLPGGKAIGTAKPTHAALIAIAYALLGIHDYTPLVLNAAASTAGVALTWAIGRKLFDPIIALLGALLLAVSEYDVLYARSALSESDGVLVLLVGTTLWLHADHVLRDRGAQRYLPLAGAAYGLAFTVNYRLVVYIGILVALDLLRVWQAASFSTALRRIPLWLAGLVLAPLLWQLIGVIARSRGIVLFQGEVIEQPTTYLQEVFYQLHQGKQSHLLFEPGLYLRWWLVRQGWLLSAALIVGIALAVRLRSFPWILLVSLVVLPYLVFVFAPFVVPRNLVPIIPFASVLASAGVVTSGRLLPRLRVPGLAVAALVLALVGGEMSWRLTAERSGFAAAAAYVGTRSAFTTNEILIFYLRGQGVNCRAPDFPFTLRDLRASMQAGLHYAVFDRHTSPLESLIKRREPVVARYSAAGPVQLGESPISSENGDGPLANESTEYVDIYRLDPSRLPAASGGTYQACTLDEVV